MSGKQIGFVVLALLLAALVGVAVAQADGPVIWKQHCPAHHDVVLVPAGDWDGVHVLCIRSAEEVTPVNNR